MALLYCTIQYVACTGHQHHKITLALLTITVGVIYISTEIHFHCTSHS